MNIRDLARSFHEEGVAYRRMIHKHPELSGQEYATAEFVEDQLSEWGIANFRVGDTGVVGIIDSGIPGKTVALRADMDALPINEETGVEYASVVPGVMHACGHDCHTSGLMIAAKILSTLHKTDGKAFAGKIKLIFQASEEKAPGGAGIMVRNGIMDDVDGIFGLHVMPNMDVGTISVDPGPRMAASLRAHIHVKGKGGHGGAPHETIDAIVAGSAIVMNLQTLVSRELPVFEPVAVTVGLFHGGEAHNVVAQDAHLAATIK
ncbi:MAG TPA: amidohydrolase, partial [Syntrophorhabdus aromaticivorans]|nr:amidohydrolase [Syntrophorhabdus aromaticivorans]